MEQINTAKVLLVNRAIVINPAKKFLLIKRASSSSWKPSKWELPGGKLEEGQDINFAMEREVFEETGLPAIVVSRLAYYSSHLLTQANVSNSNYIGLTLVELVGIAKTEHTEVIISKEHSDFRWVTLNDFMSLDVTDEARIAILSLKNTLMDKYLTLGCLIPELSQRD